MLTTKSREKGDHGRPGRIGEKSPTKVWQSAVEFGKRLPTKKEVERTPNCTITRLRGLAISVFTIVILTALVTGTLQVLIETILRTLLAIAIGVLLRWTWTEFVGKMLLKKDN